MKLDFLKLKKQRENKALTQEALAGKARLSVRTIQRAERGDSISKQNILEIAQALEINHTNLFVNKIEHSLRQEDDIKPLEEKPHLYFSNRFSKAFPGQRDIRCFEDLTEIKNRLLRLLEPPLVFSNEKPFWYWFDGGADIFRFEEVSSGLFLMNFYELNIRQISSVYASNPRYMYVYVETDASPRSGLNIECFSDFDNYGVYKGREVSHAEYIDGATELNSELIEFDGSEEFRERPLKPFNFLIGPRNSILNSRNFEEPMVELLRAMLDGGLTIHEFNQVIEKLPNNIV